MERRRNRIFVLMHTMYATKVNNRGHKNVKKLQILMSSYNGKAYLRQQLNSIMMQDCEKKGLAEFCLLIRDDGSSDGTQLLLEEYSARYPDKIKWYQGTNKGAIESFFELMANADEADYYALADQDDYWFYSKMSAGIKRLTKTEIEADSMPLLYCCRPTLADKDLGHLSISVDSPAMRPAFGNALIENIVTGCTTVFNNKLRQMVINKLPKFTTMHDRWLYLTATCFGKIYYDEKSYILYRQHENNAVGKNTKKLSELKYRIKKFQRDSNSSSRQAVEFMRIFGEEFNKSTKHSVKSNQRLLKLFINGKKSATIRKKLIKTGKLYRQRHLDNKIFMVLIWLNVY